MPSWEARPGFEPRVSVVFRAGRYRLVALFSIPEIAPSGYVVVWTFT
jgi:hypothetical protein